MTVIPGNQIVDVGFVNEGQAAAGFAENVVDRNEVDSGVVGIIFHLTIRLA